ncbi:MAG: hypothetical protein JST75_19520 [Bacteroidetes bacterium]|nr:hypothetical protein [Bacteroidota bacterium]
MTDQTALFQTIKNTVTTIDIELNKTNGKGIFFAPELYTAFCMGKDIYHNRFSIFGMLDVEWKREMNLGDGGPSDICFKAGDTYLVIELKLRDTIFAYQADIEKLKRLPATYEKFFCVLIDKIKGKNDGRLEHLKSDYKNEITHIEHHCFQTWNDWYSSEVCCHLNLYKVS